MFQVGDKVIRNRDIWDVEENHLEGIVEAIGREDNFRLVGDKKEINGKELFARRFKYWSLIEPVIQQPTPFVFIEEGMDYIKVGSGDYVSLENAHKRCLALRKLYRSDKIYSYVRVEE